MYAMLFYRGSGFPKPCCPLVQVNEKENQFLVQIHTEIAGAHPISIATP